MRNRALSILLFAARTAGAGPCLPGGAISLCEHPVTGTAPGATRSGGTLVNDGWRVDQKGDFISYDLGALVDTGAVRFDVSGIRDAALDGDTHIVFLLNDSLDPKAPAHQIEVVLWGSAVDPMAVGTLNLGVSGPQGGTTRRSKLDWSGASHRFDLAFDQAAQTVTLARDGALLYSIDTRQKGVPLEMSYRYAHLALPCCIANPAYQPVVGADYALLSVAAGGAAAPDMAAPPDLAAPRDLQPPDDLARLRDGGKHRDLALPAAADLVAPDEAAAGGETSPSVSGGCALAQRPRRGGWLWLGLLGLWGMARRRGGRG